jgi:hypothetical protein
VQTEEKGGQPHLDPAIDQRREYSNRDHRDPVVAGEKSKGIQINCVSPIGIKLVSKYRITKVRILENGICTPNVIEIG